MTAADEDVSGSDRSETGDTRRWRTFAIAGAVATLLIAAAITLAVMSQFPKEPKSALTWVSTWICSPKLCGSKSATNL